MAGKPRRQLVETLGSVVLHVCKCEQHAGVAETRVVSSIKVQITFIREALRISPIVSGRQCKMVSRFFIYHFSRRHFTSQAPHI